MNVFRVLPHHIPITWRTKLRLILVILLCSHLTIVSACIKREDGIELAKAGISTANTMSAYYGSLQQDVIDIWEMEAFLDSLARQAVPVSEQERLLMKEINRERVKTIDSLNRRILLTHALAEAYNSLLALSSYNAAESVKQSAGNLEKALTGIPDFPGSSVIASGLFSQILSDLASLKQSGEIKKASEVLLVLIDKIHTLLDQETEAYLSIIKNRRAASQLILGKLIEKEQVLALPLIEKVPRSFGLSLVKKGEEAVKDQPLQTALIAVSNAQLERTVLLGDGATQNLKQTVKLLSDNHKRLQAKDRISLDSLLETLNTAQTYLGLIAKARAGNNPNGGTQQ